LPFIDPNAIATKEPSPGWKGKFFHSKHMTFAYYDIEPGASLHSHHHDNEEVWHIIEGELDMVLDGETRRLHAGEAAVVSPDAEHSIAGSLGCRVIVVDFPVRHSVGSVEI
jgi:mannose-6-phosphate isomerase-like protein (cupin superfamily)